MLTIWSVGGLLPGRASASWRVVVVSNHMSVGLTDGADSGLGADVQ